MNRDLFLATKHFIACSGMVCLLCTLAPAQSIADDVLPGQIAKLQQELGELSKKFSSTETANSSDNAVRLLVKQAFDLEMELQHMRIAKAEADLEKVKQQFAARQRASNFIIDDRVAVLTKQSSSNEPELDDGPASLLSTEGWQLWRKRDLRSALVKFEASVAKDPTDANALNGLGWSYLQTGQHKKAIDAFQRGRKIDASHGRILNGLGQAYQALGRTDEARALLVEAIESINEDLGEAVAIREGATAPWFVLVRQDIKMKKYDDAIGWAERYLKHKPDDERMSALLSEAKLLQEN
ncbi:tetratricopeptide repeat protein [Planctomycetes bacterium K23_9]|uniref:Tetratricopeptide repeat protein n=1 Tax=Stieleria marina TaxID=1930275 RepID=A0A517NNA6_9BACT|nr:Tetratricopeptide repeat protein [Planctomycetes bacterium K23_9]